MRTLKFLYIYDSSVNKHNKTPKVSYTTFGVYENVDTYVSIDLSELFFRPIHLSHAYVALVTLLSHFLASLEEFVCFVREHLLN